MVTYLLEKWCPSAASRAKLVKELESLPLPSNPLDSLISDLGGISKVAEISGRTCRLLCSMRDNKEVWSCNTRHPEQDNLTEMCAV